MRFLATAVAITALLLIAANPSSAAVSKDGRTLLDNLTSFRADLNQEPTIEQKQKITEMTNRFEVCLQKTIKSKKMRKKLKQDKNKAIFTTITRSLANQESWVIVATVLTEKFLNQANALEQLQLSDPVYRDAARAGAISYRNIIAFYGQNKTGKSPGCQITKKLAKMRKWSGAKFARRIFLAQLKALNLSEDKAKEIIADEEDNAIDIGAGYARLEDEGASQNDLDLYNSTLGGSETDVASNRQFAYLTNHSAANDHNFKQK